LVSHYLNDIPCENYNYIFVFVKVTPKILLVVGSFFSRHGVHILMAFHLQVLDFGTAFQLICDTLTLALNNLNGY